MKFKSPLIFIIKEKMKFDEFYVPTKTTNEYENSGAYLKRMKEL